MERRHFLSLSGTSLASVLLPQGGVAQNQTRAAIVIGVDKAGSLPKLFAAASGAKAFANWLEGEGFLVKRFIDGPDIKVKINPIFEAINEIVDKGTFEQLIIYFSGHGFLNSYRELWMLSGAPNNPNQAISLLECDRLCRRTGIPNVVFISDACRSTATSLAADSVRGSVIFPTTVNSGGSQTKVDIFLASQEGDPAYEVGVGEASSNYAGIYTTSFLDAFRFPEDGMVSKVGGIDVVLNRDLEGWLSRDVNRRAQEASITIEQRPDTSVLSDQYIGRVKRSEPPNTPLPEAQPTIGEAASMAFTAKGFQELAQPRLVVTQNVQSSDKVTAFNKAQVKIEKADEVAPRSFETETGIFVSGTGVEEVITNQAFLGAEMAPSKGEGAIRLYSTNSRRKPASVAVRFSDGSGTVLAGLPGYIATIVVDDGRVVSIAYNRSGDHQERLVELRNLVATAARFGTFRIEGKGEERNQKARALADKIRVYKAIDPTLGIYAAYAYADADLLRKVESVREFMNHDIRGQIFDVALLAGKLRVPLAGAEFGVAPFCPMLSQGWGLLRISNIQMPPEIDRARDHIKPALWTTFRPKGMDLIVNAMRRKIVT